MSSSSDIGNIAKKVASARESIANENTDYQNAAVLKYWKGDIASSFKNANTRVKTRMNALLSAYNSLHTKLQNLDTAVSNKEKARKSACI